MLLVALPESTVACAGVRNNALRARDGEERPWRLLSACPFGLSVQVLQPQKKWTKNVDCN
eukprot:365513-Chlamydomonas_euryale.AAC.6